MSVGKSSDTACPGEWEEGLGITTRLPRPGLEEIGKLFARSWPPEIFLREHTKTTDIVLRLPVSSCQLPSGHWNAYFGRGATLKSIFEEILWKAPPSKGKKLWYQLAGLGYSLYAKTWLHMVRAQYLDRYPKLNDSYIADINELEENAERKVGRRPESQAEKRSLATRFQRLLGVCREAHLAAQRAAKDVPSRNQEIRSNEIRKKIWTQIEKDVCASRAEHLIFGGQPFSKIPSKATKRYAKPSLVEPNSWTPEQLTIAILCIERGLSYESVQKKTRLLRVTPPPRKT
jgi:hypothetical protein